VALLGKPLRPFVLIGIPREFADAIAYAVGIVVRIIILGLLLSMMSFLIVFLLIFSTYTPDRMTSFTPWLA